MKTLREELADIKIPVKWDKDRNVLDHAKLEDIFVEPIITLISQRLPKEDRTIYGGVKREGWEKALIRKNAYKAGRNDTINEIKEMLDGASS